MTTPPVDQGLCIAQKLAAAQGSVGKECMPPANRASCSLPPINGMTRTTMEARDFSLGGQ